MKPYYRNRAQMRDVGRPCVYSGRNIRGSH